MRIGGGTNSNRRRASDRERVSRGDVWDEPHFERQRAVWIRTYQNLVFLVVGFGI